MSAVRLEAGKVKSGKKAVLKLRLDRAARTTLTVLRRDGGVPKGKRCVKPAEPAKGRRCDLPVTRLTRSLKAGANTIELTKRLSPGRYKLTLVARAGGKASKPTTLALRVTPG